MSLPIITNENTGWTFTFKTQVTANSDFYNDKIKKDTEFVMLIDTDSVQKFDFGFETQPRADVINIQAVNQVDVDVLRWEFENFSQQSTYSFTTYNGTIQTGLTWLEFNPKLQKVNDLGYRFFDVTIKMSPFNLNILAGYTVGGFTSVPVATIDKIFFDTEVNASISSTLAEVRFSAFGFNSATSGFTAGGYNSAFLDSIEKLTFNTDLNQALTNVLSVLSTARGNGADLNSTLAGYSCCGYALNVIDKLTFSDDICAVLGILSCLLRSYTVGINSSTYGYIMAGYVSGSEVNSIDRVTFSNDANNTIAKVLSSARDNMCGFNSTTIGYTTGGDISGVTNKIEKMVFATETCSDAVIVLSVARENGAGINSNYVGLTMGGSATSAVIDRLIFATETNAAMTAVLSTGRVNASGFQSGGIY
jgi:hypothetical protein